MPGATTGGVRFPLDSDPVADGALAQRNMAADVDPDLVTFTPTITNLPCTVNYARYRKVGRQVTVEVKVTATGAATGTITLTLPVSHQQGGRPGGVGSPPIGLAHCHAPANTTVPGVVFATASNAATIYSSTVNNEPWAAAAPFTWANGHELAFRLDYWSLA